MIYFFGEKLHERYYLQDMLEVEFGGILHGGIYRSIEAVKVARGYLLD